MLIVLPPSETKREGGSSRLGLDALSFATLREPRRAALAALTELCRDAEAASRALHLGPRQQFEIDRNRSLNSAPVLPAIERYTGVLYGALYADAPAAESLSPSQRAFASRHLLIHSALFGLISAHDRIPAYRLSHDSRLPKLALGALWREPISSVLAAQPGLILDLRSESYARLGPVPKTAYYVRVLTEDAQRRKVALSHFNKKAKGEFVRALLVAGIDHGSVESLLEWARGAGIHLSRGGEGVLELVV